MKLNDMKTLMYNCSTSKNTRSSVLPEDADQWLAWSTERLVLQQCAWCESLRGAPASMIRSGVYLPEVQTFSPDGLQALATQKRWYAIMDR